MNGPFNWGAKHNILFNRIIKQVPTYNFLTSVFTPTPVANPRGRHLTIGHHVKKEFLATYFSMCGEMEVMGNQGSGDLRTIPAYPYGISGSIDCELLENSYSIHKTGDKIGQQVDDPLTQLEMAQADQMSEARKAIAKLREWIVADSLFSGKLRMDAGRTMDKGPYALGLPTQVQFDYLRDSSLEVDPSDYGYDYWELNSDTIFEQLQLYRDLLSPYGEPATDILVDSYTYNILTRNEQVVEWLKTGIHLSGVLDKPSLNSIIGVPEGVNFETGVQSIILPYTNGMMRVWQYDGKITAKTASGTIETRPFVPYGKALFFNNRAKGVQVRVEQKRQLPDYQLRNNLYDIQDMYFDAETTKKVHNWEMYSRTVPVIGDINQTAVVQVLNPTP